MTSAVVTDIEVAAIPTAITLLKAVQAAVATIGTNPAAWPATVPAAILQLEAAALAAYPSLVTNEATTVVGAFDTTVAGWISTLQAKLPAAA